MAEWMRTRYVGLYCQETNRGLVVDTFEKRLWLMRHRISAWASVVAKYRGLNDTRMVMILLTYHRVVDYKPGHINLYLKDLKRRLGKNLLSFSWVAEIQSRGAVHYHLILLVNRGTRIPLPDKSGMWSHGLSGIHTARTPYYLLKYTGKEKQKDLSRYPKSCRLYAASVRGLTDDLKAEYAVVSGLKSSGDFEEGQDKWLYVGSAVTSGYIENVLMPSGAVLK